MPQGFFTVEQWKPPMDNATAEWVEICHVNGDKSLSDAIRAIEERGEPGFYRVIQTQRQIWAEMIDGTLRLRKWHAMKPEDLARTAEAFDRDGGCWPETK